MSKITLVTGGSRSGKSTFAENILKDYDEVLYIATAIVTDKEMEDRIKRHREERNNLWETHEGYKNLDLALEKYNKKYVLLDCVTVMTTNFLFEKEIDFDNFSKEDMDNMVNYIKEEFRKLIEKARELNIELVMVTNEVGWGIVPEYRLSRIFRDIAGFINQYIAKLADEVYLVSCGLPLKLK
ncbi:bifunctional adenosylcobinamide kinase/adenosylcobinamide-phosphate guanylyltransferase [Hathewaya massiliensis]|uniref:bifunctional adenosylcobinamide kinase/adenosylcobinamide-phosphate guanylyltransferase n=1 Tax=Hathewaya massiliensis TaxID=1964382 RepID=UPI00115823D0|nr:bifunctional adenosylcobinamide kinase/adenosylcobinamide-phosphate guanylyltransferase [Hathewaya massiliensis]